MSLESASKRPKVPVEEVEFVQVVQGPPPVVRLRMPKVLSHPPLCDLCAGPMDPKDGIVPSCCTALIHPECRVKAINPNNHICVHCPPPNNTCPFCKKTYDESFTESFDLARQRKQAERDAYEMKLLTTMKHSFAPSVCYGCNDVFGCFEVAALYLHQTCHESDACDMCQRSNHLFEKHCEECTNLACNVPGCHLDKLEAEETARE